MKRKVRRNYIYIRIYIRVEAFLYMILLFPLYTEDRIVDIFLSLMFKRECECCQDNVNSSSVRTINIKNQRAQMIFINTWRILKTWPHFFEEKRILEASKKLKTCRKFDKEIKSKLWYEITRGRLQWMLDFFFTAYQHFEGYLKTEIYLDCKTLYF